MPRAGQTTGEETAFAKRTTLMSAHIRQREDSAVMKEQSDPLSVGNDDLPGVGNQVNAPRHKGKSFLSRSPPHSIQFLFPW